MSSDESTQRAPPRTKAIHLVCSLPGASTIRMPLDDSAELVFGRANAEPVDIAIDDPRVSRRHALVFRLGGVVCVRDLGSENGTRVGTESIRAAERRLRAGDTFEVGAMRVVVATDEGRLVVADPGMRKLHAAAVRVARRGSTVLLVGEPGVGKSTFAECIHDASTRADKPFVRVDCTALTAAQLDSLLEVAQGGTFHLAILDALSPLLQPRIAAVLQSGSVRVLCSTARELTGCIDAALHDRIRTLTIAIPPLRERRSEIPSLAAHFLRQIAASFDVEPPTISPEAEAKLIAHGWPCNVSDLRDVMEYAFALAEESRISPADLPASFGGAARALIPSGTVLRIRDDTFSVSSGPEISLTRRAALRRVLLTLARRGRALSVTELFAAGWPGESAVHQAAEGRVRTAIWTLRKMGLDVKTTGDGYALDDTIRVEWA